MTHNARGKVLYFVMVSVDLFGCNIRMRLCEPFHKHKGGKFMFLNLDVKENVLEYCRSRERRRNSHNLQDHRRHCLINKYVFYKHNHILKAEIVWARWTPECCRQNNNRRNSSLWRWQLQITTALNTDISSFIPKQRDVCRCFFHFDAQLWCTIYLLLCTFH